MNLKSIIGIVPAQPMVYYLEPPRTIYIAIIE